jgi:hypothetical protein
MGALRSVNRTCFSASTMMRSSFLMVVQFGCVRLGFWLWKANNVLFCSMTPISWKWGATVSFSSKEDCDRDIRRGCPAMYYSCLAQFTPTSLLDKKSLFWLLALGEHCKTNPPEHNVDFALTLTLRSRTSELPFTWGAKLMTVTITWRVSLGVLLY